MLYLMSMMHASGEFRIYCSRRRSAIRREEGHCGGSRTVADGAIRRIRAAEIHVAAEVGEVRLILVLEAVWLPRS